MPDERDDARLDDAVRAAYRAPQPLDARSEARALERVARSRDSGLRWWFAAQLFELRPAVALAVTVLVLVAGVWGGVRWAALEERAHASRPGATGQPAGALAATAARGVPVTFVLRAPGATSVCVAGDFNSWDAAATPMSHAGTGDLWIANVELPSGVHLYSFVLDGAEWRPHPYAPPPPHDAFRGPNSVIVVNGAKSL